MKDISEGLGGGWQPGPWRILTNDNVCLGSGLFDDGRVVQRTVDELHIGILSLDFSSPVLIADQKCVVVVRVLFLKRIEGVTTDIACSGLDQTFEVADWAVCKCETYR